jgi:hypothetical protein
MNGETDRKMPPARILSQARALAARVYLRTTRLLIEPRASVPSAAKMAAAGSALGRGAAGGTRTIELIDSRESTA